MRRHLGSVVEPGETVTESYIEALKSRIRALQLRVDETSGSSEAGQVATPSSQMHHQSKSPEHVNRETRNELHDAMQEASYLSLSAMAERTDKHRSSMEGLSFMTLFNAAIIIDGANPTTSCGRTRETPRPSVNVRKLALSDHTITYDDTLLPFRTYCSFLSESYPYMAKAELEQMFNNVMTAQEEGTVNSLMDDCPEAFVLAYLGIATGIFLSPHDASDEALGMVLLEKSKTLVSYLFDQAKDLAMVQCLTAFTIHSMFTTSGGSPWHLLGLAMTRCVASGMHTSKVSDTTSEEEGKRSNAQAFWTLYILDTHLSAFLDRPFCLSDQDILVTTPPVLTPGAARDDYGPLVQHAQLIRAIKRDTSSDPICHFINLRHWYEILDEQLAFDRLRRINLLTQGYVELIKRNSFSNDLDQDMVLDEAAMAFASYLDIFEEHVTIARATPSSLDLLHIFAMGSILCRLGNADNPVQRQKTHQAINILTILSTRYSSARSLRDILMECLMDSTGVNIATMHQRLHELIEKSEICVSDQLQGILLGRILP